ncbi:MAG TPA: hypothetical protein VNO30_40785 [Kofleriaceae bacterium]|nr:hypothetical protein [Kofleriaceae bacterium]
MTSQCDAVAERLALGESLEPLAAHIASCAGCTRLAAVPGQLGAARRAADPGLGFSARMTVGAQQLIAVRRRRRAALGLAATVAAGALGVVVFTRAPRGPVAPVVDDDGRPPPVVEMPRPPVAEDAPTDVEVLVNLADTGRSRRMRANWQEIEQPLAAYRTLVHRVGRARAEAEEGDAP